MKKIGCLLCVVCMWNMPAMATTLQEAVERQVLTKEQEQYDSSQRFEMAVEYFQFYAKDDVRGEGGYVAGTFELAKAYEAAVRGHSQLYAIELYGYMDTHMESLRPWQYRTIASYVLKALKGHSKRVGITQQRQYSEIRNFLLPIHKKRRAYFPVVWDVFLARRAMETFEMDESVAQGEVAWEDLSLQQISQIKRGIAQLTSVGKALEQAKPEVFQLVVEGLQQDPFLVNMHSTPMNLGKFLARYGHYATVQETGVQLTAVGKKMVALAQQP